MSDIYVYPSNCDDFTNFGLVGALTPTSCIFEEVANGLSEVTLEHPIDVLGRYTQLVANNLLMVEVPVRTTPEIDGNNIVTSVERWTVKKTASKANRTIYKKRSVSDNKKDVKIKTLPGGTAVTMVKNYASGRCKIKSKYGTGWIERDGLESGIEIKIEDNSQSIESVEPAWTVKPQLFRIYSVEKNIIGVTVMARHISYDLLYNLFTYGNTGSITCATALNEIMSRCIVEHDFEAYTNLTTARTGVNWTRTNPIDALLNPETGLTARFGASLVRDNWELYVLHDPGLNRGVTVEYGKNMTGITYTESFDNVVTRIVPIAETKDGLPLPIGGTTPWIDSPHINDYPIIYAQELICTNCKVGKDVDTLTKAYAEMVRQANAVFENGGDLPTVSMSVEFVNLGDTAEYAQYKDLERLFLWDYVIVRHKLHNIDVTARIVSIRWNCLLDRMETMEIGSVGKTLANSGITSWQIPSGISGGKIASGTLGSTALGEDVISTRHIQSESINADKIAAGSVSTDKLTANSVTTEKLAAGSVTADRIASGSITTEKLSAGAVNAEKIEAGAITAEKIKTGALDAITVDAVTGAFNKLVVNDELYTAFARVVELAANSITAGNVTTDKLAAVLAEIVTLQAGTGNFDLATIKNLLSNALILKEGQANSMMITNLAVTSANLLSATIGELVLKGSDGGFYRVYVGADGIIHTEAVSVSLGEIEAGQTIAGNQIVETTANIRYLNAQSIKGQTAIIDEIITTALTAGKITATEALIASATIPSLYTTSIQAIGNSLDLSANESIRLIVDQKNATYYRDSEPENAVAGDVWIDSTTFKNYVAEGMTGRNLPQFDAGNGDLLYKFNDDADEFEFYIDENGNLMSSWDGVTVRNDACLYTQNTWREVVTSELRNSFIEIMQNSILIKSGGNIHIGAGGKLDVESGSAHFKTSDYSLSIMAGDGTEDTVLDFDAESKTLRVDEVNALNIRPYVAGTVTVLASDIGGVDGLANMLSASRYEHVVYRPDYDEASTEPIVIKGCDSTLVEIIAGSKTRIPPIVFSGINTNILFENVEWNNLSGNALEADSGNICIKNSVINAMNGVIASKHARIAWIGNTALSTVGSCTADAFRAIDCATIRLNGMIPTGNLAKATGGVIESIDVTNGAVVEPEVPEFEEVTTTLTATQGYYGTESYWTSGELFQGYTNAKGVIFGCMKFTMPSDAESIVSATLTLKAASSIGTGAAVNVYVFGSDTAYGSRPTLVTRYINKSSAVAAGQSCSLNATTAAAALLDGTAKQLVLYTNESAAMSGKAYSKNYAKFTSAKLKITYRRKKA